MQVCYTTKRADIQNKKQITVHFTILLITYNDLFRITMFCPETFGFHTAICLRISIS